MRLRGAWADAELEVRRACGELRLFAPKVAGSAFRELGQIRLRIGDLDGAEEAFLHALELGSNGQPGLAQLHLARGRSRQALVGLLELLEHDNWSDLDRAPLLPTLAEAAVDAGELDDARAASEELDRTASLYATPVLNAAAALTRGRIELASEQEAAAAKSFRRAVQLYQDVDVPYEAASARFLLARAYRSDGDTELAASEFAAARDAFDRLGAVRDARLVLDEIESQPSGSPVRAATTAAVAPSLAERTFMFTDIVGSTALVAAIGDAAWSDLVHWHDDTLRVLFAKHVGQEVDHAGDGFFVAFAQPAAATACAVAIQRTLARHRRDHGFAPEVRIGIHAAVAQHGRGGYRGKGVHEAARVAALAEGGEILVSRLTLGDDRFAFGVSEPRSVMLKGLAEPLSVVTLDWR
jgi:class 3 adenylate cyclase